MGVNATDYRGGLKPYLVPGKTFCGYVVGIYQVGAAEGSFHRGKLKRRNVRDINYLSRSSALVRLIESSLEAQRVPIPVLGEKSIGADFGADRVHGKTLGERHAK